MHEHGELGPWQVQGRGQGCIFRTWGSGCVFTPCLRVEQINFFGPVCPVAIFIYKGV